MACFAGSVIPSGLISNAFVIIVSLWSWFVLWYFERGMVKASIGRRNMVLRVRSFYNRILTQHRDSFNLLKDPPKITRATLSLLEYIAIEEVTNSDHQILGELLKDKG